MTSRAATRLAKSRPAIVAPRVLAALPGAPSRACERLPFWFAYRQAGVLDEADPLHPALKLTIDLHSLDCGAPDSYGHTMELRVELRAQQGQCLLERILAGSREFGRENLGELNGSWQNTFVPARAYDLADRQLEAVELRDSQRAEALILAWDGYWFFERVPPGAKLEAALYPDDAVPGLVYGATGARGTWDAAAIHAPELVTESVATESATADALGAFNQWATRAELRSDPALVARRALGAYLPVRVESKVGDVAARVTVGQTWWWSTKNERVFELDFSRRDCPHCPGGKSGWWLWRASARWDCKERDDQYCLEEPLPGASVP